MLMARTWYQLASRRGRSDVAADRSTSLRKLPVTMLVSIVIALVTLVSSGCLFDEHVSDSGLPYLERLATSLDLPESPAGRDRLAGVRIEMESWASTAGRDGRIVKSICDRAITDQDWPGARKSMLDAFPYRERQTHLD